MARVALVLGLLPAIGVAPAAMHPEVFDPDGFAREASDILVARQSAEDGSLVTVLETWKGSRAKGEVLRVPALRNFWKSQPQLDDPSGLDQISRECDEVLQSLGRRQP